MRARLLGQHHAINLLAAFVTCRSIGLSPHEIEAGLRQFRGLHRRLERLPDRNSVLRYDDYAHHPTAIRAVLAALREAHPTSRIVCVFQPHQLSRTHALEGEFADALAGADETVVVPVYAAREAHSAKLVDASRRLANAIRRPARGRFSPSLDHVRTTMETAVRPGDLLITLGAGDIDQLHHALP
jgi:UDP-N-acetylmuramate--alanine ligase